MGVCWHVCTYKDNLQCLYMPSPLSEKGSLCCSPQCMPSWLSHKLVWFLLSISHLTAVGVGGLGLQMHDSAWLSVASGDSNQGLHVCMGPTELSSPQPWFCLSFLNFIVFICITHNCIYWGAPRHATKHTEVHGQLGGGGQSSFCHIRIKLRWWVSAAHILSC